MNGRSPPLAEPRLTRLATAPTPNPDAPKIEEQVERHISRLLPALLITHSIHRQLHPTCPALTSAGAVDMLVVLRDMVYLQLELT